MANDESKTAIEKANDKAAIEKAIDEFEVLAKECNPLTLTALPVLRQTITMARCIHRMRALLTDDLMDKVFMPLQGCQHGFTTDLDHKGEKYPRETIREVVIAGMMVGLRPIGNEIVVISSRCYGGKNGLERLVREWPGLTDLIVTPGVPAAGQNNTAMIEMRADWLLNGKPMTMFRGVTKTPDGELRDTRFTVRVNAGMGPDAVIGKATRKLYRAMLDLLGGSSYSALADTDSVDTIGTVVTEPTAPIAPPEQDGQRIKLGRNREQPKPSEPEREPGQEG